MQFAYDLGPDNYSLPDYFEIPQRYIFSVSPKPK